jgi:hypothetical protein
MNIQRRHLLTAGAGLGAGLLASACSKSEQAAAPAAGANATDAAAGDLTADLRGPEGVPHRRARIVPMFQTPDKFPNAVRAAPEGFWIAEQRTLTDPPSGNTNHLYLLDMQGKVLRKVENEGVNISGLGLGGGKLWIANNAQPQGIVEYDEKTGQKVALHPIPLGNSGCHGVMWHDGKLYINALRFKAIMRVDPTTWQPEYLIPYNWRRTHELEWDNGAIWIITGTLNGPEPNDDRAGMAKYDAATGKLLETVSFDSPDFDPHGLTIKDGVMYTCDAAIHPGWKDGTSKGSGYVGRIEFI